MRAACKNIDGIFGQFGKPAAICLFVLLVFSGCDSKSSKPSEFRGAKLAFSTELVGSGTLRFENAFPQLVFEQPSNVVGVPGTDQIIVLEHNSGRAHIFSNRKDVAATEIFFDFSDRLVARGELGLVEITFDPDFQDNGWVYVISSAGPKLDAQECNPFCSLVSRFTMDPNHIQPLDRETEQFLLKLRQPENDTHNLSNLVFGPDGMMYIASGDGGYQFHARLNAQKRTDLFGAILRYDARSPEGLRIPRDNPFVGAGTEQAGVIGEGETIREEIYAFGLRNPYRMSFDAATGRMFVADVGQAIHEEINFVVAGENYGWPIFEGTHEHQGNDVGRSREELSFPVLEYGTNNEISAVVGGFVYRASQFPQLRGEYLFADFLRGSLWRMDPESEQRPIAKEWLAELSGGGLATLEMINGEIFATNYFNGTIHKLVENAVESSSRPPQRLSQTGIFKNLASLETARAVIAYSVNSPLWSDGVEKQRWLSLPTSGKIQVTEDGAWSFPVGTVLVKHFSVSPQSLESGVRLHLETRVLFLAENGWQPFTYVWNDDQQDAHLMPGSQRISYRRITSTGTEMRDYDVPANSDCAACHNGSAGHILGLSFGQLNRRSSKPLLDLDENQIDALLASGLLDSELQAVQQAETWVNPAVADSSVEIRARSYLAANCAHCHNPALALSTKIDLRFDTALDATGLIDVPPSSDDFGLENARLIAPGDSASSVLLKRMNQRGNGQMPPLATKYVDEAAIALIRDWINAMPVPGNASH